MPKDPTRVQPNYKIGGHHINEHEYENNKGQITEEEKHPFPRAEQNQRNADLTNENAGEKSNAQGNS